MRWLTTPPALLVTALLVASCARKPVGRDYHLEGQVIAVDTAAQQVVIRSEEIPGYMAAMTMPFTVKEPSMMAGKKPGDLVNGTLYVAGDDAYLTQLTTIGSAPLDGVMPPGVVPILDPGAMVPNATFTDQLSHTRTIQSFRGTTIAITFIYTRCPLPTYCPLMDRNFVHLQQQIKQDPALAGRVHLVTITVDPEFDTASVLKKHAAELGADPALWTFLTGKGQDVSAFAGSLGVFISRGQGDDGPITHNLRTAIIDPAGRLAKVYDGNDWTPDQLLHDLSTAARDTDTKASTR